MWWYRSCTWLHVYCSSHNVKRWCRQTSIIERYMVDIEAGAIVVSAHLGMPWQNRTAGSMNIPSGDCMDKIVLVARKLDERSSLKGCMPPWCELMRAFDPKGLLTRLHDFFKIMWHSGFLNRYRKNLNVRTSTESQNWWSKVCPKRKGNPAMTSWTYSLPMISRMKLDLHTCGALRFHLYG